MPTALEKAHLIREDIVRVFLRDTADDIIWPAWLMFHPSTALRLAFGEEEYDRQRADVIRRYRRRVLGEN